MTGGLLKFLPWDSSHFGIRIARATARQLDGPACQELEAECVDQDIECLYFLADAADQDTVSVLQAAQFDFVDIRLTLAASVGDVPNAAPGAELLMRLGQENDLEALLPVAGGSFTMSRFYVDRRFGVDKAMLMYQTWLEKSLKTDFAAAVVVAEMAGQPVGFVTCHLHEPAGEANLGLVGVAPSVRGAGCARGMVAYAARHLSRQGVERLNVITQGRNIAAQRLYQRCGFAVRSVELWFHKWFKQPA